MITKKTSAKLLSVFFLLSLLFLNFSFFGFPANAAPANPEEGIDGGFLMFKKHIVPCGRSTNDAATNLDETDECTLCHFIIMGKRVYDLMLSLLIIVSIVMLAGAGALYIFSGANPGLKTTAKEIIKKTLIGFGLFLGSWLLVLFLLNILSVNTDVLGDGGNNSWFEFTCETDSFFETN